MLICFTIRSNFLGGKYNSNRSTLNYFLKVGINKITKVPIIPSIATIILTSIIFMNIKMDRLIMTHITISEIILLRIDIDRVSLKLDMYLPYNL